MPISFACPHCSHGLNLKEEFAGKRGKCPKCQQVILVPAVSSPELALASTEARSESLQRQQAATPAAVAEKTPVPKLSRQATPPPAAPTTQQLHAQVMAGFQGSFEKRRVPLSYRLGALLTAIFMILLPLVYVGVIVLVGSLIYWHLTNNYWIMSAVRGRAVIFALLAYAAPLVIGGILVVFMIKPLFNWANVDRRTRTINRESDPLLFAFVDRICEIVGAPKPVRIEIDCDINASASFPSWASLFTNRLVLTVGMPLAAGLSLQQLAGVLAHEFGHFSQGTGMRLTYIVRSINHWFLRVVYERDSWDHWLAASAAEFDLRVSWILYLAMLFVWLTRKVLWVLMMLGHLVAGFMLREMEFDADSYEARLAGSATFAGTAKQLNVLQFAWAGAQSDLSAFHREGRLADNLPKLIMANMRQIPDDLHAIIDKRIAEGKTGWLDSHPCDRDRIAAANSLSAPGVFHNNLPATVLFRDFNAASKNVTWDFYRDIFGPRVKPQDLSSVDELLVKQGEETEFLDAIKRFFGGRFPALRPLQLPSAQLQAVQQYDEITNRFAIRREVIQRDVAAYQATYARYDDLDTQLLHAMQSHPLLACEIRVKPKEGQTVFRTRSDAANTRERLQVEVAKLADRMNEDEIALGERLYFALCLLFHQKIGLRLENTDSLRQETQRLFPVVAQLSALLPAILKLRNDHAVLAVLFEHFEENKSNEAMIRDICDYAQRLHSQLREILEILRRIDYPFDHAHGPLTVSTYFVRMLPPSDEIGQIFDASSDVLSKGSSLYSRALGRLCAAAEAVEGALGYEPLVASEV